MFSSIIKDKEMTIPSLHEAGTAVCVSPAPRSSSPLGAVSEYPPASGDHSDGCPALRMGRPAKNMAKD